MLESRIKNSTEAKPTQRRLPEKTEYVKATTIDEVSQAYWVPAG